MEIYGIINKKVFKKLALEKKIGYNSSNANVFAK